MKKIGIIILILLILGLALYVGGFLVGIAIWLFKIMIGVIGLALFVGGVYIGRWTNKN
jgi:hypothetical protein